MGMPNSEVVVATDDQRLVDSQSRSLSQRQSAHARLEPGRHRDAPRDVDIPACAEAFVWRRLMALTREHWGIASPLRAVTRATAASQQAN
ncbi:MAG: hypothetical protein IT515_16990 [Burkholderiales bacterium]|nr:hypothetical protein [Burkholderiales bacterium]